MQVQAVMKIQILVGVCCLVGHAKASDSNTLISILNDAADKGLIYDSVTGGSLVQQDNFGYTAADNHFPAACNCNGKIYVSYGNSITVWDADRRALNNTFLNVLTQFRDQHSMDCVNKGNDLLICGGSNSKQSCEVCHINLQVAKCDLAVAMPLGHSRYQHTSVTVNDTKVMIIGGKDANGHAWNSVFSYDTVLNTWSTSILPMQDRRQSFPGATMLNSTHLLVCGGHDGTAVVASCETLDLSVPGAHWLKSTSMATARGWLSLQMFDASVYALGGSTDADKTTNLLTVEKLNTETLPFAWNANKDLPQAMKTYAAVAL